VPLPAPLPACSPQDRQAYGDADALGNDDGAEVAAAEGTGGD
jgi:hypothetical protein